MKTVFVDVDTQIDFLYPAGALYVPGAERIVPALGRLNRYATAHGIPLVSTVDAHAEDDPEFHDWPPHCIAGTLGQHKPAVTLVGDDAQQFIVEKQQLDMFAAPEFPRLLERLGADRYVVYGVVAEYCVRLAAMGLLRLGKPVELVADAIASIRDEGGRRVLAEFTAQGGRLTSVEAVCSLSATGRG